MSHANKRYVHAKKSYGQALGRRGAREPGIERLLPDARLGLVRLFADSGDQKQLSSTKRLDFRWDSPRSASFKSRNITSTEKRGGGHEPVWFDFFLNSFSKKLAVEKSWLWGEAGG